MTQPVKVMLLHHKEAEWPRFLSEYSDLKRLASSGMLNLETTSLPQQNKHLAFAQLPASVRRLLFFAKPDLVVCLDDGIKPVQPIFAIDVTEHVAARDHWIQRFPNLVGCAQEGIPGAFVAPQDMPNRAGFRGKADPFFFFAYDRVVEIHQTPIYIAEWPSTDGEHLDGDQAFGDLPPHDAPDIARTIEFFNLVLEAALKGADISQLMQHRLIVDLRHELRTLGYQQLPQIADFQRLTRNLPAGRPLTTAEFESWLQDRDLDFPDALPDRIAKRDDYLIMSPLVTPPGSDQEAEDQRQGLLERIKKKGGDPYTQQPLVFDYLFCRLGQSPAERDKNLVIDLTVMDFCDFASYVKSAWEESPLQHTSFSKVEDRIPIYTLHLSEGLGQVMKNFIRLYAYSADVIVFRDGIIYF